MSKPYRKGITSSKVIPSSRREAWSELPQTNYRSSGKKSIITSAVRPLPIEEPYKFSYKEKKSSYDPRSYPYPPGYIPINYTKSMGKYRDA